MNRIYRTVWSETRGAFIVAHEKSKARGKPSSSRTGLVSKVAAALLALGAGQAIAVGSCGGGATTTITSAETSQCVIVNDESLVVDGTGTNAGSIVVGVGAGHGAVQLLDGTTTAGSIRNSGTIQETSNGTAILLGVNVGTLGGTITGGIANSGIIDGGWNGINTYSHSLIGGGISNTGTIIGHGGAGIALGGATLTGGLNNNGGLISGNSWGLVLFNGSLAGGITNSGRITGGDKGIALFGASTINGGISNTSTVASLITAFYVEGGATVSGGITNSGLISGGVHGINVASGGTITGQTAILIHSGGSVSGGINNSGLIQSNGTGPGGINLLNGTVTGGIVNSGKIVTIKGGGGIVLFTGSSLDGITNLAGGTISGDNGIWAGGGSSIGNITNSGLISGTSGVGIKVQNTSSSLGSITNTGNIRGSSFGSGIYAEDHATIAGDIINSNSISGSAGIVIGNFSTYPVPDSSTLTGSIVNQAGGAISGTNGPGVWVANGSAILGGITNSGSLSSIVGASNAGVRIENLSRVAGGIHNEGTISGAEGIHIDKTSTLTGGITNSGMIAGVYVANTSTLSGGLTNTGVIEGVGPGLAVYTHSSVSGAIVNAGGAIVGGSTKAGIDVANASVGSITNSGTISGGAYGLRLSGANAMSGTIVNSGVIRQTGSNAQYAGLMVTDHAVLNGDIINESSGSISGNVGIWLWSAGSMSGGISNSGTIAGATSGMEITQSTLTNDIANLGTASAILGSSGNGIETSRAAIDGNIRNEGTIQGELYQGLVLRASTLAGQITNAGWIDGHGTGLWVNGTTVSSGITNSGTISGGRNGLGFNGGSTVAGGIVNGVTGVIRGATSSGLFVSAASVTGGIVNQGLIEGGGREGLGVFGGTVDFIDNQTSGTISGAHDGIRIGGASAPSSVFVTTGGVVGSITNSGMITGTANAGIDVDGGTVGGGTDSGAIVNLSGATITGGQHGIRVASGASNSSTGASIYNGVVGSIANSGLISGATGSGIEVDGGTVSGAIVNQSSGTTAGTISGGQNGIRIGSVSLAHGTSSSANISQIVQGVVGSITNSGLISGATGSGIDIDGGTVSGVIDNQSGGTTVGTISGGQYGIRVGAVALTTSTWHGSTSSITKQIVPGVVGSITNSGVITGGTGSGIEVQGGTVTGTITNQSGGSISGGQYGIRIGSLALTTFTRTGSSATSSNQTVTGVVGSITNSGLITGTVSGIEVDGGTVSGAIDNQPGGAISGGQYGIRILNNGTVASDIGSIVIAGAVTASASANQTSSTFEISVSGKVAGISVTGSQVSGGITNAGHIDAQATASATYSGSSYYFAIADATAIGIDVNASAVTGDISNAGNITASASATAVNTRGRSGSSSWCGTSSAIACATANGFGISLKNAKLIGSIVNAGTIAATANAYARSGRSGTYGTSSAWLAGIRVSSASLTGGVTNSGTITATNGGAGIEAHATTIDGAISNNGTGTVSGGYDGIELFSASTVHGGIANSGFISGGQAGISMYGSVVESGIANQGTISGGRTGIAVRSGSLVAGGIASSGLISGATSGISIDSTSTVTGQVAILIQNGGSVSGGIDNRGVIAGSISVAGIVADTNAHIDSISNASSGSISGGTAILADRGASIGNIANSGTITGSSGAGVHVRFSSSLGSITNNGVITGTGPGIFAWGLGTINGDITNGNLISGNQGVMIGCLSSSYGGCDNNPATLTGSIINQAGGTISGITGIRIEAGSLVSGGITNSGTISGGTHAINTAGTSSVSGIFIDGADTAKFVGDVVAPNTSVTVAANAIYTMDVGNKFTVNSFTNSGTLGVVATQQGTFGGTIVGDYAQDTAAVLREYVTDSTRYGQITVSGTATFANNTGIDVELTTLSGLVAGSTIAGIMVAGTMTGGAFNVTDNAEVLDNSVLLDFTAAINGNSLDLTAISGSNYCGATVSGAKTGPCEIGFDAPDITVNGTGVISGGPQGIYALAGSYSGDIGNAGTVSGSQTAVLVGASATLSGGITNSGLISGSSAGIRIKSNSTLSGGIINSGTLSTINGAKYGVVIFNNSSLGGGIVNEGTISGSIAGIGLSLGAAASGITNSGLISGSSAGIGIVNGSRLTGGLTNTGEISAGYAGIGLLASSIAGGIHNDAGTISAIEGIFMSHSSLSGGIANIGGTIAGASNGIFIGWGSSVSGGISNSGTISATLWNGIGISSATVTGGITNSGLISGPQWGIGVAPYASVSGGIVNNYTGVIRGGSTNASPAAILVGLGSRVSGGITNYGLIDDTVAGIYLKGGTVDSIVNGSTVVGGTTHAGTISGGHDGIRVESNGTISGGITNSGLIIGTGSTASGGIAINGGAFVDSLANKSGGRIVGDAVGIFLNGNATLGSLTNEAGGLISGSFAGMYVGSLPPPFALLGAAGAGTISAGISNAGTIAGGMFGALLAGEVGSALSVGNFSTIAGGLANTGTISGGVGLASIGTVIDGDVSNQGANACISGTGVGIDFVLTSVTGHIANSGIIQGNVATSGGTGVSVQMASTVTGGLTNSGTISGSSYAVNVDGTSTLPNIAITGSNTAAFNGDVFAQNTDVAVKNGSTFSGSNAFDVKSFVIESNALFNMGAMLSASTSLSGGITVSNGVSNTGKLAIAAGTTGTIAGNFINTGTFSPAVAGMSSYGKLAVSGTASVAGTIDVNVIGAPSLTNGGTLTGVIHAGSVSGSFGTVHDNSVLFDFVPVYTGTDMDLTIKSAITVLDSINSLGNTPATGAAAALDAIIANTPSAMSGVVTTLGQLDTKQKVSDAASQTLPLFTGDTDLALLGALGDINHVVQARIENNLGMSSGDGFAGDKHAWLKPFGSWADQHDDNGVAGYKANTGGFALGGDAALGDRHRVGLAFAYASSHIDGKSSVAPQSATVDLYHLIAYGSYTLAPDTELNYLFDVGNDRVEGTRRLPTFGVTARSTYDAWTAHAGVGFARTYVLSEANTFTPSARIDYTSIREKGYSESGAGALNLNVDSHTAEQLLLSIDGKFAHKMSDSTTLIANLGGAYDANAKQSSITAAFAGDPGLSFVTRGLEPAAWTTRGGLGVVTKTAGGTEITARYDADSRRGFTNQTVSVKARWAF